jgi:hypothetical protein|tara:strand:+ start:11036 stop:11233 length:198 start_codon:yes stop_codon:yes gene_type:complete
MTKENEMAVGYPYSRKNHPSTKHYVFVKFYNPEKGVFKESDGTTSVLNYEDMTPLPFEHDDEYIH